MMNLNYNKVLEMVSYILEQYDLAGIVDVNYGQEEEYFTESKEIVDYIKCENELSILGLSNFIQVLFIRYFESVFSFEDCTDISNDILSNLELCKEEVK